MCVSLNMYDAPFALSGKFVFPTSLTFFVLRHAVWSGKVIILPFIHIRRIPLLTSFIQDLHANPILSHPYRIPLLK